MNHIYYQLYYIPSNMSHYAFYFRWVKSFYSTPPIQILSSSTIILSFFYLPHSLLPLVILYLASFHLYLFLISLLPSYCSHSDKVPLSSSFSSFNYYRLLNQSIIVPKVHWKASPCALSSNSKSQKSLVFWNLYFNVLTCWK